MGRCEKGAPIRLASTRPMMTPISVTAISTDGAMESRPATRSEKRMMCLMRNGVMTQPIQPNTRMLTAPKRIWIQE